MNLTIKSPAGYVPLKQWDATPPDLLIRGTIPAGAQVEYIAHVVGGMVKVRHDEQIVIINPACTNELR